MTWREATYNIIESFRQSHTDAEITPRHALYWLQVCVNRYIYQKAKKGDRERWLTIFPQLPVKTSPVGTAGIPAGDLKYVEIPGSTFTLREGEDISYVAFCDDTGDCCGGPPMAVYRIDKTTAGEAARLYMNEDERPSPAHPYRFRAGDKLFLLGFECVDIDCVEVGAYMGLDPGDVCDLDEIVPIPPEGEQIVIYNTLGMGKFLLNIPADRTIDGRDDTGPIQDHLPQQGAILIPKEES